MLMKPVPNSILAVAALVSVLLLSGAMPINQASEGGQDPVASLLPEPSEEGRQGEAIPAIRNSAQFPFLIPE